MSIIISGDSSPKKVHAGRSVAWMFSVSTDISSTKLRISVTTGPEDNAPEWDISLYDSSLNKLWSSYSNIPEISIDSHKVITNDFKLEVVCPRGARYNDKVTIEVIAYSESDTGSTIIFEAMARQSIMILKTQIDQEKNVAEALASKANTGERDIYAILSPVGLRGYIFVEGMNTDRLHDKARNIKKAKSFIEGETDLKEVEPYLTPISAVVGIVEGDIVELVNGPFKGEKARVQQIDQSKEEITVELIEAMVPIPVTVKGDSVRVIEKEK